MKFYYNTGPNPAKVALFLEEAGLDYEVVPVDARTGGQHTPEFRAINPNGKLPAILDDDVRIFDSSAILLYLGRKTGKFYVPPENAAHAEMLSWMLFVASGIGPYSGQASHFLRDAPEPKDYALNRYTFEAERHWIIVEDQLAKGRYMLGETYSIVDMSLWGWGRFVQYLAGAEAWNDRFPNLKRLIEEIDARPAAARAKALAQKFQFKQEMDEDARRHLFPQNQRLTQP
ncbi:glutathione S-transferase family protein [Sphingomonas immobilis]|uniref:glutathione S-transferase family protein n=1 Tax=Sphingomonas immobilis TaxID=3063997 RepID=UPI0031338C11